MRIAMAAVVGLVLSACTTGSVRFSPAKGAGDYPATKDAYRVQEVDPECERLGLVVARGNNQIPNIAEEAASRGGTHYVVTFEDEHDEVHTQGSGGYVGQRFGNTTVGSVSTTSTSRKVHVKDETRAMVFRCASDGSWTKR